METNSSNGKSLAPTNPKKGIGLENGVEGSKGPVRMVRSVKGHQVRNPISSLKTDDNV